MAAAKKKDQAPEQPELDVQDVPEESSASPTLPQDGPAQAEATPVAPSEDKPAEAKRYRVWPHGNLLADGELFKAGEDVPFGLRDLYCVEEY